MVDLPFEQDHILVASFAHTMALTNFPSNSLSFHHSLGHSPIHFILHTTLLNVHKDFVISHYLETSMKSMTSTLS